MIDLDHRVRFWEGAEPWDDEVAVFIAVLVELQLDVHDHVEELVEHPGLLELFAEREELVALVAEHLAHALVRVPEAVGRDLGDQDAAYPSGGGPDLLHGCNFSFSQLY